MSRIDSAAVPALWTSRIEPFLEVSIGIVASLFPQSVLPSTVTIVAFLLRRDQVLVHDSYTHAFRQQGVDPAHRMVLHIALVQPERELVHVPLKVLLAERVVHTVEAALQDGPHALDAIGMRHAIHVLLGAVVDRSMVIHQVHTDVGGDVRRQRLIGRNHRVDNSGLNRSSIRAGEHFAFDLAASFSDAEDGDLAYGTASLSASLPPM